MTEEEKEGVKMIQYLQNLAGQQESEEVSLENWKKFSEYEKLQTKLVYKMLGGTNA